MSQNLEELQSLRRRIDSFLSGVNPEKGVVSPIPVAAKSDAEGVGDGQEPEPDEAQEAEIAQYARALFEEGQQFEIDHFGDTSDKRPNIGNLVFGTPESLRSTADKLEAGNLFDVIGTRNSDITAPNYKNERPEGSIGRAMRIRGAHVEGGWHDIIIQPNISSINEIFDEERKQNGWAGFIKTFSRQARKYGIARARLIVDVSGDQPIVRPTVVPYGQCVRTPHATSFKEIDGCNYVVFADTVTNQQIEKFYPEVDTDGLNPSTGDFSKNGNAKTGKSYEHTKIYSRYTVFLDDPTLEEVPFGADDQDALNGNIQQMALGQHPAQDPKVNHMQYIRGKVQGLDNLMQAPPPETPEEDQMHTDALDAFGVSLNYHLEQIEDDELTSKGLRYKYPNGREIIVIGDQVAKDVPNSFNVPWRLMVEEVKNEEVVGRIDGRGDPEIMIRSEIDMSVQRSRIEDIALALGLGKKYRHIDDKNEPGVMDEGSEDNDPNTTGFYKRVPPEILKGEANPDFYKLYEMGKSSSQQDLGVNETTIGGDVPGATSGVMINLLQKQNETLVTGELDKNLRTAIEHIVDGMLAMMKVCYIQKRRYYIDGESQYIAVNEILTQKQAEDPTGKPMYQPDPATGQDALDENGQRIPIMEPLPNPEVTVKPFSNYPNKWEQDLALFMEVADKVDPVTMTPLVPSIGQAIQDKFAERYPEFGPNGKYGKMNPVMVAGYQAIQAQQAAQQAMANGGAAPSGALPSSAPIQPSIPGASGNSMRPMAPPVPGGNAIKEAGRSFQQSVQGGQ